MVPEVSGFVMTTLNRFAPRSTDWWTKLCRFVGHGMRHVSPGAVCVWIVLFRNSHDSIVQIGIDQMAEIIGCNERTVRRKLHELIDAGYVQILSRGRLNVGPTRYLVRTTPLKSKTHS